MKRTLLPFVSKFFLSALFLSAIHLSAYSSDSTIFRDDFDRSAFGRAWQASPSWSISNGMAYNFIDGTGGKLVTAKAYDSSSYILETKASGFTPSYFREFRITFGQHSLSNDSMYVLSYKPYSGGRLTLSLATDNLYSAATLDEVIIQPVLDVRQWYTFKIAHYKNGLLQVYLDKGEGYLAKPILEAIDSTYKVAGHVGWQIDTQTAPESFFVDWITAYTPSIQKTAREKPVDDDLITQVSAGSGLEYRVAKLDTGIKQSIDREYTITSVPPYLRGGSFIQSAMDDKRNTSDTLLTFFLKRDAIIYIGYDSRETSIPAWLTGWTKTGDSIITSDARCPYFEVYSRMAADLGGTYPNPVFLGGNLASPGVGAEANYIVAAIAKPDILPLQAEDASLSGAIADSSNSGYFGTGYADYQNLSGDYVEWTVNIDVPGSYKTGFIYANGLPKVRSLKIDHDGRTDTLLDFSSTFSWETWSFLNGNDVYLTRGIHKIRATATGTGGPNIDQLSLYYTSPAALALPARKGLQHQYIVSAGSVQVQKAFPNPFTKSTIINYSLAEKANVNLSIYTLQGQNVQVLVNGIVEAGEHQAVFNAGSLSSGIYIYRIRIGNELKVGKLIKN